MWLREIYIFGIAVRVLVLIYGLWQDSYAEVKFTDVDYYVFHDAAEFVFLGHSPYMRATYRYTPVLAWLLVPNIIIHHIFGRLLFIGADFLTAILIKKILTLRKATDLQIVIALMLWLLNPLTFTISCRGNAESIMAVLVYGTLLALTMKRTAIAGAIFALAVHFKIYPITYSLAIYLFLGNGYDCNKGKLTLNTALYMLLKDRTKLLDRVFTRQRLIFFLVFASTLFAVSVVMFILYGYDFLEHAYLYHVTRQDTRHNFSAYFYSLYLGPSAWQNVFCLFIQFTLISSISFSFSDDLPFAFFLITYTFITFNKIVTSQYFIWYVSILPMIIPGCYHWGLNDILSSTAMWFCAQLSWLCCAYLLEFKAKNNFHWIWLSSIVFLFCNTGIISLFIKRYNFYPMFHHSGKLIRYYDRRKRSQ